MKKLVLLALVVSFQATATQPTPAVTTVTSVMNGSIDVGTFVSAAPNQYQTQTSIGSLTGSTVISGTTAVPVITSSITGAASSVSSGTGITHPSFIVNGSPASAVVQGVVNTTLTNYPLVTTTIVPDHHDHDD